MKWDSMRKFLRLQTVKFNMGRIPWFANLALRGRFGSWFIEDKFLFSNEEGVSDLIAPNSTDSAKAEVKKRLTNMNNFFNDLRSELS